EGPLSTLDDCGECGKKCEPTNVSGATCETGTCAFDDCETGFQNCDSDASNGCESEAAIDVAHCGGCDMPCDMGQIQNVENVTCDVGACSYDACQALFSDCDVNVSNGCETSINTLDDCGRCGTKCEPANAAAPSCSSGTCEHGGCTGSFGDCDNNAANGCETDVDSDTTNCGSCGKVCPQSAICTMGSCTVEITKDAVDRGWWKNDGSHTAANDNTATGQSGLNLFNLYNSYFIFDLAGVNGTVVSAKLKMEIENYTSTDNSESLSVWDVSTKAATLEADGNSTAIFQDLMTGQNYGSFLVKSADVGKVLDIPLNAQAVSKIKAALGGKFSVGLHVDTIGGTATQYVRFSKAEEVRTHQLVLGMQ
ncbi:MAG: hypothetical protein VB934_23055, partial [Polyangiaceae bacterium]